MRVIRGVVTTAGGNDVEVFEVRGISPSMTPIVQIKEVGATPVSIVSVKALNDQVEVTFSDDPADDHVLSYAVIRGR